MDLHESMQNKRISRGFFALLAAAVIIAACVWFAFKLRERVNEDLPSGGPRSVNATDSSSSADLGLDKYLPLGNPSKAVFNAASPDDYLLTGEYFSLSYNRGKGIPNWVAWRLSQNSFGTVVRQNNFRPDNRLPNDWAQIKPDDYSGGDFERGHLCPSADRSGSEGANSSTFLMSNIAPQTHDLNAGPWEKLERYSRSMARRNMTLYIVAGQYGTQGKLRNKVTIPTNFWKIIIVAASGTKIDQETRIIAVDMPNVTGIRERNWRDYKTTARQIEENTGYDLLSSLPVEVQKALRTKIDVR